MCKICVFAGTTEGRKLVEFLSRTDAVVTACAATEYGGTLLNTGEGLRVHSHPILRDEMRQMMLAERFDLVVDATHPYAASITESISNVCSETGTEYLRLLRAGGDMPEDAVFVGTVEEAVKYLENTVGNILLTTGSKQLESFSALKNFSQRVYARVLPVRASLQLCTEAGLDAAHIIAMQGPFSEDMNIAMLRAVNAKYMVTKDSGTIGGFGEKAAAARKTGARLIVIGRPPQYEGLSFEECIKLLCCRFSFKRRAKVSLVGIGPGDKTSMTISAHKAVDEAECLIGAGRMLEDFRGMGKACFEAIAAEDITGIINSHPEYCRFAVLFSGDTGFYSGAKKLLPMLESCDTELLPGISSLSYFCSRLGCSYEDVACLSLHGREANLASALRENRRLFVLTGGENSPSVLCERLSALGYGDVLVHIGQRLSYSDESIISGTASELSKKNYNSLSAVLIEQEKLKNPGFGLPDESFVRGNVPMTKSEVRAVCLSKLQLAKDSLCWDIGAGTGSVSVELALQCPKGHVYAVERDAEALELIAKNKAAFGVENLGIIAGAAPEACMALPVPSHVFIGGSGGNAQEIIGEALNKNPAVRIVATAVTLETVAELSRIMKEFLYHEAVTLNISKNRKAGNYELMQAQNPVTVFTMQNTEEQG